MHPAEVVLISHLLTTKESDISILNKKKKLKIHLTLIKKIRATFKTYNSKQALLIIWSSWMREKKRTNDSVRMKITVSTIFNIVLKIQSMSKQEIW